VAAAVAVARAHGLGVTQPAVLADLFSVMVHLRPAPVVARVPTWVTRLRAPGAGWLDRELAVTTFLSGQGLPVVAPSRELPSGPHRHDGFTISFWTYLRPDPDRAPTAADCSAMLVDLHATLRSYPGELPALGTAVIDLRWLERVDLAGDLLGAAGLARLRASAERMAPFLEAPGGEVQPVHGDAHPGNLVATREAWCDRLRGGLPRAGRVGPGDDDGRRRRGGPPPARSRGAGALLGAANAAGRAVPDRAA
jgi:hypothetical protein